MPIIIEDDTVPSWLSSYNSPPFLCPLLSLSHFMCDLQKPPPIPGLGKETGQWFSFETLFRLTRIIFFKDHKQGGSSRFRFSRFLRALHSSWKAGTLLVWCGMWTVVIHQYWRMTYKLILYYIKIKIKICMYFFLGGVDRTPIYDLSSVVANLQMSSHWCTKVKKEDSARSPAGLHSWAS